MLNYKESSGTHQIPNKQNNLLNYILKALNVLFNCDD